MRVCPICQWPFTTERELNTHIEIKHPETVLSKPDYPPAPHIQRSESIVDVDALQDELTRLRNERARIKVYSAVRDAQTHQDLAHMLCLIHRMVSED